MKKLFCLVLSFLMLFCLCACKDKKDESQNLLSVLNSETPFVTEKNTTVYLKDYKPFYKYEDDSDFYETESVFVPYSYTFVDLDKDETPELIIAESTGETYLIIHQEKDKIYGYSLYCRWFQELKQDGSFMASSGAAYNDYRTISFDKNTYKTTIIAKDYFVGDEYDELINTYIPDLDNSTFEIDGKSVSFEEIQEFEKEWINRIGVEWTPWQSSQTQDTTQTPQEDNTNTQVEKIYNDFLSANTTAQYNGKNVFIDEFTENSTGTPQYAFFDRNGDNIPELCIDNGYFITTFWVSDNKLAVWHEGNYGMQILSDGHTLETHYGGAPNHTDNSYITHSYNGKAVSCVTVSVCHANGNDVLESQYELNVSFFNGGQSESNSIKLSKEQYDKIFSSIDKIGLAELDWKIID